MGTKRRRPCLYHRVSYWKKSWSPSCEIFKRSRTRSQTILPTPLANCSACERSSAPIAVLLQASSRPSHWKTHVPSHEWAFSLSATSPALLADLRFSRITQAFDGKLCLANHLHRAADQRNDC